jgi:hypothetical protein
MVEKGYSVIATKNKQPLNSWKKFTESLATDDDLMRMFSKPTDSYGLVMGRVSGGLETLDVDDKSIISDLQSEMQKYFGDLYSIKTAGLICTPNGFHYMFRNEDSIYNSDTKMGSQKLAKGEKKRDNTSKILLETRGENSFIVGCGSTINGKDYKSFSGKSILDIDIPVWTQAERSDIYAICKSFNKFTAGRKQTVPTIAKKKVSATYSESSWSAFDKSDEWRNVVDSLGFDYVYEKGERIFFKRRGSDAPTSANFHTGLNKFYCYSTSTSLEADQAYSPSQLYSVLHFGDTSSASIKETCKKLSNEGYGEKWSVQDLNIIKNVAKTFNQDNSTIEDVMNFNSATLSDMTTERQYTIVAAAQDESRNAQRRSGESVGAQNGEGEGLSALETIEGYVRMNGFVRNELTLRPETHSRVPLTDYEYTNTYLNILRDNPRIQKSLVIDVLESDRLPSYHPFREYFDNLEMMGGTTNILNLFESLNVECKSDEDLDMSYRLFIKWLLQFITSSYQDAPAEIQLCLTGSQGGGKTFFFKNLLPKALSKKYMKSIQDFPRNDSDAKELLANNLLVLRDDIMGEGTSGSSNAGKNKDWIKSILSADMLTYRTPYARTAKSTPRFAILAVTTNDLAVLGTEETANRRILPLRVNKRDKDKFDAILENGIDDLWREVKYIYESVEDKRLLVGTTEEEIGWLSTREDMRAEDTKKDWLLETFIHNTDSFVSTKDIVQKGSFYKFNLTAQEINLKMTDLGFLKTRKWIEVNGVSRKLSGWKVNVNPEF